MDTHAIELGWDVYTSDGRKLGTIDRLVFNSQNQHLEQLVVDEGLFSIGKLIDLDLIDRVEGDRVMLLLTTAEAKRLPDFVSTQFVNAPEETQAGYPGLVPDALGPGRILHFAGPTLGIGYPGAVGSARMDETGAAPEVENVRNLPEQDVVVDAGSDVVDADGKKIGTVDRIVYGEDGVIQCVVVKAGFLFKHEVTIPGDLVAEMDDDRIRLCVPAEDVWE